jgi:hypothetical protein
MPWPIIPTPMKPIFLFAILFSLLRHYINSQPKGAEGAEFAEKLDTA